MNNQVTIKVAELLGSNLCISAEDGQKLYGKIEQQVKAGKQVKVSFCDETRLIPFFLNVAIGQLYGSFDEEVIQSQLKVEGLRGNNMKLFKVAVSDAKEYFANREHYDQVWREFEKDEE